MSARPRWRGFSNLISDFDRWNRILIPKTREGRDRVRSSRWFRASRWTAFALERFSEEGQLLAAFCMIAATFALDLKRSDVYVAWATVAGLLFASWSSSFFFRLRDVSVELQAPRSITVGTETALSVVVRNGGHRPLESVLVRGPFLPWDGTWTVSRRGIRRLLPAASERVELVVRFRSRGEHQLDSFRLRALVPFGFAFGPPLLTRGLPLLVVPRAANITSFVIPHDGRHPLGSSPRTARVAESRELMGVRPYRTGDAVRDLHAKTWARTGRPVVREYREQHLSRIGIFLDTDVGDAPESDFEAAISLVAGMVDRVTRTDDVVDTLILGKHIVDLSSTRATGTRERTLESLARVEVGAPLDPVELLGRLAMRGARLSCLIVVTVRWDEPRRLVVERLAASGGSVLAFVVSSGADATDAPRIRHVSPQDVHAGAPMIL